MSEERVCAALLNLKEQVKKFSGVEYWIPGIWINASSSAQKVDYGVYFSQVIDQILNTTPKPLIQGEKGEWSRKAVVYNLFPRTSVAFDNNNDGKICLEPFSSGFMETGTFTKAIALLPYIQGLGVNVVYLLPITSIGKDGSKGDLGSPYAIRNPYKLNERLSEPCLGLGSEQEFKAFVEAAHILGMRVILEFVFRTASKDSDWIPEHPEWFYWIHADIPDRKGNSKDKKSYGPPVFPPKTLEKAKNMVQQGERKKLPPPPAAYRKFFTMIPSKVQMEGDRYIGILEDGTRVRVPGAFADWPPDDNQPPWTDVTYLRLYDHPNYNYISYNTVRMYDEALAKPENKIQELWDKITGIIPYYIKSFDIDGVMLDMGHALPFPLKKEIIKNARDQKPDFTFWDENFAIDVKSKDEGYNSVLGYSWCDTYPQDKFLAFLKRLSTEGLPLPFLATPETHNTPRAAFRDSGISYAKFAMGVLSFLPGIPLVHSGFELFETFPINTGLDFTDDQIARFPSENLPLFSHGYYDWLKKDTMVDWIKKVLAIRSRYIEIVTDSHPETFKLIKGDSPRTIVILRSKSSGEGFILVANADYKLGRNVSFNLPIKGKCTVVDLLKGKAINVAENGDVSLNMDEGEVLVFPIPEVKV